MESKKIYKEIGKRIKLYRKQQGLTQGQLAAKINLSRTSLANLESGRQQILTHYLYEISEALNLKTPSALLVEPELLTPPQEPPALSLSKDLPDAQRLQVLHLMDN